LTHERLIVSSPASPNGDGEEPAADPTAGIRLADELRQPLAAASNYIGAARQLLGSGDDKAVGAALSNLDKAEGQILRAGSIVGRIRQVMELHTPDRPDGLA
jgi:phosphoglycerate-specific signal transduction histidine kinase